MDGVLPVYKPVGITSYDCVRRVKRFLPRRYKIGHAGTLDPFADGVLLLLLGHATKRFDEVQGWKKTYRAVARLGSSSDTLDMAGKIDSRLEIQDFRLTKKRIEDIAQQFVGRVTQEIPAYSAAKVAGQPRYKYARKGETVIAKTKPITIYSIEVVAVTHDQAELAVVCGSGTYIRQLSYDIFKKLGIDSYLERLTREAVGEITGANCVRLDELATLDMIQSRLMLFPGGLDGSSESLGVKHETHPVSS